MEVKRFSTFSKGLPNLTIFVIIIFNGESREGFTLKVLFFSVSIGAGHDLAAQALAAKFKETVPEATIEIVDTFKYINPVLNKVVAGSYMETLKFTPKVWGYLYEQAEEGERMIDLGQIMNKLLSRKLEELLNQFEPDVIICSHAFPCGIISALKEKNSLNIPLVAVITDYTIHSFWLHPYVNAYIIPSEGLKYPMLQQGIAEKLIQPKGIPIRNEFGLSMDKKQIRTELGLENKTTILVMGGGLGLGSIPEIVHTLGNCGMDLQVMVIAGSNVKLEEKLKQMKTKNKLLVYGYIDFVAKLMAGADLIITKPGGLTTAEVLATGLPMVIVAPLPGQEDRNTEFLLNSGVAAKVRKVEHLPPLISQILENPLRLKHMEEMAECLGKPEAAKETVDFILKDLVNI